MHPARYLLSLVVALTSSVVSASQAQTCTDQVRQHAHAQSPALVSAATLRMPAKAKKHFEKAREAVETNQLEEFEREAAATLAIAPDFAEVYLLRGVLQVHNGHNEAALESIATARSLQAEMPFSSIVVASALTHMSRFAEADAELDRFHYINENWQWEFEKTRAELGQRNIDAALHWSQLTEEDAPEACADSRLLRINALELAGLKSEAIPEMEAYLALGKNLPQREVVMRLLERDQKAVEGTGSLMATR